MPDPTDLDTGDDTDARPGASAGMPRWVKVFLIIALGLLLLLLIGKVTGLGGEHGPGRHSGSNSAPSSVVDEDGGHRSPIDHSL